MNDRASATDTPAGGNTTMLDFAEWRARGMNVSMKLRRVHPDSCAHRLRLFGIDISQRPRCGAQLRVVAVITDPRVIAPILEHIGTRAAH